jgi:hypothetical protein
MSDKTATPNVISPKTGVPKPVGDDAQQNAADRVEQGTPARAQPIIEREGPGEGADDKHHPPKTP